MASGSPAEHPAPGVMIFGGFAPFIATFLVRDTGSPIAPSVYVAACALAGLVVLIRTRSRRQSRRR